MTIAKLNIRISSFYLLILLESCLGSQRSLRIDASQVRIGTNLPYQTITNVETNIELPDGTKEIWYRTETTQSVYTLTDWRPDGSSIWRYQIKQWQIDQRSGDGDIHSTTKDLKDEFPPVTFVLSAQGDLLELQGWDAAVQKMAPGNNFLPIDTAATPEFVQMWTIFPDKKVRKGQKWSIKSKDEALQIRKKYAYRLAALRDSIAIISGSLDIETAPVVHKDLPAALLTFQYQIKGSGHSKTEVDALSGFIRTQESVSIINGMALPVVGGTGARPVVFSVRTESKVIR